MGSNEKCKLITISSISGFIKKDPIYRKAYLRDYLEKLEISHVLSWTYSGGLYLKKIKHFYMDVEQLKELFPTVFSKKHTRIKLRNSFWGKMLMKFFKVNYLEDELAGIKLMGIRCVDVCLILQVLLFIKEKEENSNLKLPLTTTFLEVNWAMDLKNFS